MERRTGSKKNTKTVKEKIISFMIGGPFRYYTSEVIATRTKSNHNTVRKVLGQLLYLRDDMVTTRKGTRKAYGLLGY